MSKIDRQRERQGNEWTFLGWLRTSIALIGFGFAIARFGLFLGQLETNEGFMDFFFVSSNTAASLPLHLHY